MHTDTTDPGTITTILIEEDGITAAREGKIDGKERSNMAFYSRSQP
jgi:hypothetical protein